MADGDGIRALRERPDDHPDGPDLDALRRLTSMGVAFGVTG